MVIIWELPDYPLGKVWGWGGIAGEEQFYYSSQEFFWNIF